MDVVTFKMNIDLFQWNDVSTGCYIEANEQSKVYAVFGRCLCSADVIVTSVMSI